MALTKAEKQTLKSFGNDPNYRIELDARKKIIAVPLNDKIEAPEIKFSTPTVDECFSSDENTRRFWPIAKTTALAFMLTMFCSCANVYQGYDRKTNTVIIGRIDSIYTTKYKGEVLKWKVINGKKIEYRYKTKPVGAIDTVYVKRLIL